MDLIPEIGAKRTGRFAWLMDIILFLAILVAGALLFPLYDSLQAVWHADGYRPAEFVVTKVVYSESHDESVDAWWAEGTIDGLPERYFLGDELASLPPSQTDLDRMVKPGRVFAVWLNRDITREGFNGDNTRILPRTGPDPVARSRSYAWRTGPAILVLLAGAALTRFYPRRK
jgi:hypothetical protein